MLKHLTIKNYALIRHLELEPSAHLNVITGETGAGKSIMLGAIGLLMGNRAETKVLWDENEKCVTEGIFNIKDYKLKSFFKSEDLDYDDNTVIRREISPGGKSRAFINDTPVTLEVMKRVGSLLMDIHSQHETLLLGNQTFQLKLIDAYAENQSLLEQYAEHWSEYLKAKKSYETLTSEAETLRQEGDYIRFQLDELTKANFEAHEQEALESELKIMEHAEEIKSRFQSVLDLLSRSEYASRSSLSEARGHLQSISSYADKYTSLFQRIESLVIEMDDLLSEIENEEEGIEFDPERSEFVKERLSVLYRLLKKHRAADLTELLVIQENLREKDNITSNVDEALAKAKDIYGAADKKVRILATKISDTRKKTLKPLSSQLVKLLQEVGIPNATLQIDVQNTEPSHTGIDKIDILFSANKGIAPRPLAQVASGGEFSRLMFCIKYVMAEKTAMPTLILDEIDSGVSGEVAIKLGNLMKTMSKTHQLIAISHLPQVAAKGDAHYFVYKDNSAAKTISSIRELKKEERVEEIAKMIGGEKPSKIALQNAQELLTT
ncbi:DNA repair protein RecN [Ohtaekwangia koreensis]|uniref:DNA repair protein RecN n=1 Tax=Ohtaekwangia koreensis TaxID=688867 RepID=A0A1T5IV80_9BACT|nr:DNA repair protein RecN [Ohtaekwangia koreensis]SKC43116.1 DNA repair protein RecN (Recombination protein N) [Ohtaekwangia koreensis]